MKIFLIISFIILTVASASAGGFLMLHVGSANGSGGSPPVNCGVGAIDLSTGCKMPMLGG